MIFAGDIESTVSKEECAKLAELARGKLVLEVGSYLGRSTIAMASTAEVVHSVDWHIGDLHNQYRDSLKEFLKNLEEYKFRHKVRVHIGASEELAAVFASDFFEFIFLDSFHAEEAVKLDILNYYPKLRPGGFIAFHDYGMHPPEAKPPFGVTQAVDEFVDREALKIDVIGTLAVVGPK
jgi:predicted O-methyltransferase YrrM